MDTQTKSIGITKRLSFNSIWLMLILLAAFVGCFSCESEKEPLNPILLKINILGFDIANNDLTGSAFSEQLPFNSFPHKYAPASLVISRNDGFSSPIVTGVDELKDYQISLPPGEYEIRGSGGVSDYFEDGYMGYYVNKQSFVVSDTSSQIGIRIRPMCGLMMIVDDDRRIDDCKIVNRDYSFPFIKTDTMYYMYCFPHSETNAYIFRTDGTKEFIYLAVYSIGYIHRILSSNLLKEEEQLSLTKGKFHLP